MISVCMSWVVVLVSWVVSLGFVVRLWKPSQWYLCIDCYTF
jgi:hypothetical protein